MLDKIVDICYINNVVKVITKYKKTRTGEWNMETKEFHISDILSITTGRLVSTRHIDGVYDILNFMTGDNLFTHVLPRASKECKPFLLEQFPQLASSEMDFAVAELDEMLKTPSGKDEPEKLILGWLSKLTCGKYGVECDEMMTVNAIPKGSHTVKNPIDEAVEMMGGSDNVAVVSVE